jgi:hypothetical protein
MGRERKMGLDTDGFKVCDHCGSFYLNFCLHCKKAGIEERVHEIMDRYQLTEDRLIKILADHISEGSFPALNLAIAMKEMKPAGKSEVKVEAGGEIRDAKDRLVSLLDRLSTYKAKDGK